MTATDLSRFADKYLHAREAACKSYFERGTSGLEQEWNVLDSAFRPLHHVGSGPDAVSFIEALRGRFVPPWFESRNDPEVFHWLTEWNTHPYYDPLGTVFEARLLEGVMLNALSAVSLSYGERLRAWHGNLLYPVEVNHDSIPNLWNLTKRRYLQRCVDLFGDALATAGVHTNVSLPEPLLSLDFLHQPAVDRRARSLVAYRNDVYIRGARVLRAFAALFAATAANTPLRAEWQEGRLVLRVTENDSNRLLQFPCPAELDVPELYASHEDYVRISSDLARRRIRFGNNNWTPTRARSDREYVERIISVTSDQLHEVYRKGLYRVGEADAVEQLVQRVETENLIARIDLPMARVEIRVDEGGHDLDLDVANVTLRELLLIRSYADPRFGADFSYSAADVARVRRNEVAAAHQGLRANIEYPFNGTATDMRAFLRWTLGEVAGLAAGLGWGLRLEPLRIMAEGGPNSAEALRRRIRREVGDDCVPLEMLRQLVEERERQVVRDLECVCLRVGELGDEAPKLRDVLENARIAARGDDAAPIRFELRDAVPAGLPAGDKVAEIVALAQQLIRIPSVTNCPNERLPEVHRAGRFIAGYLRDAGLSVRLYDQARYPSVLACFPDQLAAPVMLSGHFDVVAPAPDDSQFNPVIDGDYLWGRGSADMKTVVATYLVWLRDMARRPGPKPPVNILLVGNEENGEGEPTGTPHVLAELRGQHQYEPALMIVGERTGERGDELCGQICVENRGVARIELIAEGRQEHTGLGLKIDELDDRLIQARTRIGELLERRMTLQAADGWKTDYRFSFLCVGQVGVFNVTAGSGHLGLEIRPIPQDDLAGVMAEIQDLAGSLGLRWRIQACEPGVICAADNLYLDLLRQAATDVFGTPPVLGRKTAGTSGRFAPRGQAVIWGQTGIGPHAPTERHFIPSIKGSYDTLTRFAGLLAR